MRVEVPIAYRRYNGMGNITPEFKQYTATGNDALQGRAHKSSLEDTVRDIPLEAKPSLSEVEFQETLALYKKEAIARGDHLLTDLTPSVPATIAPAEQNTSDVAA